MQMQQKFDVSPMMASCDPDFVRIVGSYPLEIQEKTGISPALLDPIRSIDRFLRTSEFSTIADISADPNANVAENTAASILQEHNKPVLKLFMLHEIFNRSKRRWGKETAERILRKIMEGGLYPSDLHLFMLPYCYNYPVSVLMDKGLPFIARTPSVPARHADTFIQHATQLIMYASNHQSGAAALTGFFVAYSYYAKKDRLSKEEIIQQFQNFTYTINQPVRFSAQTPFVNLSLFDRNYLTQLYGEYFKYPDGSTPDIEHIIELQEIYAEWFTAEVEKKGMIFTFPVLTANILLDKKTRAPMDKDFFEWLCKINSKYAFFNIYMSDRAGSLSSCCRLSNDIDLLQELGYVNSFGAGGDGIGSVGVCTVNFPQVAVRARREYQKNPENWESLDDAFMEILSEFVLDAQKVVELRHEWVAENIEKGLLPLYSHGFIDLDSQYCTVGICGLYEGASFLGHVEDDGDISEYLAFADKVLNRINEQNMAYSKKVGHPYNVEQVPAEHMAVNMAEKDEILGFQNEYKMYSNQWLPLTAEVDPFKRMNLAGKLDSKLSGGGILHVTTGSSVSPQMQKRIIEFAAKQGVVYMAFNYILSRCEACGNIVASDVSVCPKCSSGAIQHFTRVVGFITPVGNWHKTRREEFLHRTRYNMEGVNRQELEEGRDGNEEAGDDTNTLLEVASANRHG